MASLLRTLALGGIAAWAYNSWKKQQTEQRLSTASGPTPHVRNAGPEEQAGIKNDDWDKLDEQVDESFPASDPPGNY